MFAFLCSYKTFTLLLKKKGENMDDTGQPKFHLKTINVNAQNKTLST